MRLALLVVASLAACSGPSVSPDDGGTLPDAAVSDGGTTPDSGPGDGGCTGMLCTGVCVDVQTDPHHCGRCDRDCTALSSVDPAITCVAGSCDLSACMPNRGHCSDDPSTGCETDLTSIATCGMCNHACDIPKSGSATCDGTTCGIACSDGYFVQAGACVPIPPPRLIAPISGTGTGERPIFELALADGTDGASAQLCEDRDCTTLIGARLVDGGATSFAFFGGVTSRVAYWRAFGRVGGVTGLVSSPVWEIFMRPSSLVVSPSGPTLDVNGDGLAEVVIGATGASATAGTAYLYTSTGSSSLSGPQVLSPSGTSRLGTAVGSAGDVNGDGFVDLVVSDASNLFVYFGSPSGIGSAPDLTLPSGYSTQLASADFDHDGYADLAASISAGAVHVLRGGPAGLDGASPTILAAPDGSDSIFGLSLAAGDLNADGYPDLLVGAYGYSGYSGRAYVYYGSSSGFADPITIMTPGVAGDGFGAAITTGDLNADGYADAIIGSDGILSSTTGFAYVYYGSDAGLGASYDVRLAPTGQSGRFGQHLASGDFDGDQIDDLAVAADGEIRSPQYGAVHVFLGSTTGISTTPARSWRGATSTAFFGAELACAGDIDGDGSDDILESGYGASAETGRVDLFFGGATLPTAATTSLNGVAAGDDFGSSLW